VRTIRRDLEALQEGGLPLLEERDGKRKRGRIAFKDHLQQLSGLRG
jgi:predicted DNA-binding transcriptional regulator YafY